MDYILNGQGHGGMAAALLQSNFDVGILRPFVGSDGRAYVTLNQQGKPKNVPVQNATLRKEEWVSLDQAIVKAAKPRLKAVADLRGAGLVYNLPNGMAHTILQTETQSDITEAIASMDGLRESQRDRPEFGLASLPLPIVHKDFAYSARQLAISRNGGSPLDTTTAELAARRVAEEFEQMLIGGAAHTYAFAGGTIYGYTTFTSRNTYTITSPEASGWTPATTVNEVLVMRLRSQQDYHYGPWVLYCGPAWDVYMDDDYSSAKGDHTLRERISQIEGIQGVRTLDYLEGYALLLVQMTPDVVREVIGMEITTVQWESHGGLQQNFKVMGIMVPQIRADHNGNCGIVHGTPT
jgi:uncharacterized linocin/CFP29 family protein